MLTYMIRAVAPFLTGRTAKSTDDSDSYFAALRVSHCGTAGTLRMEGR